MGNPYAAMKLNPKKNIYDCKMWLRNYCSEEWGKVGLNILQQRADKGDIKAAYAYLYYTRFEDNSYEYLDKLVEVAKQGIEQHYYRPLRHLFYRYHSRRHLSPFKRDETIPLTEEEKQQLAQVLMIAINNNDTPSAEWLTRDRIPIPLPDSYFNQTAKRLLPITDWNSYSIAFKYFSKEAKNHERHFVIEGYAYATLYDFQAEKDNNLYEDLYAGSLNEYNVLPLSEKEKSILLSEQYKKQTMASVYIDEIQGAHRSYIVW